MGHHVVALDILSRPGVDVELTLPYRALFAEKEEAAHFTSDQELPDKARFYRGREEERARIAAAGPGRCGTGSGSRALRLDAALSRLSSHGGAPPAAIVPQAGDSRREAHVQAGL
jgi:hypothetical protein